MSFSKSYPSQREWPVQEHKVKLLNNLKDWLTFAVRKLSKLEVVGNVSGQKAIWNKEPSWWKEDTSLKWKNPTTKCKDDKNPNAKTKDNEKELSVKYKTLKTHMQENKTFPTELEEEANLLEENKIEELLRRRNSIIMYEATGSITTQVKEFKDKCLPDMWNMIIKNLSTVNNDKGNGRNTDPKSGSKLAGNDVPSCSRMALDASNSVGTGRNFQTDSTTALASSADLSPASRTNTYLRKRKAQTDVKGSKKARQQNTTPQSLQGTSKSKVTEKQVFTTNVPAISKGHSIAAPGARSFTLATTSSMPTNKPTIFPFTCNSDNVVSASTVTRSEAGIDVPSCSKTTPDAFYFSGTGSSCQNTDSPIDSLSSANHSAIPETSSASAPDVSFGRKYQTDSTASLASPSDLSSASGTSKNLKKRKVQTDVKGSKKARQQKFTPQSLQGTSKTSERAVFTTNYVFAVPKGHSTATSDAISCTIATTSSMPTKKTTIFPATCNSETVVSKSKVKQNEVGIDVPSCSRIASGACDSLWTGVSCQNIDISNDSLSFDPSNRRTVLDASGNKNPDKDCQSANRFALFETSSASPPARSIISRINLDRPDSVGTSRKCETYSKPSIVSLADVSPGSRTCPAKLDCVGTGRTFQNSNDPSEFSMADRKTVSDESDSCNDSGLLKALFEVLQHPENPEYSTTLQDLAKVLPY